MTGLGGVYPTETIAAAIRAHLSLDDFEGDQLYEGTIDVDELAAAVLASLGLTEEWNVLTDMGVKSHQPLTEERAKELAAQFEDMTARRRFVSPLAADRRGDEVKEFEPMDVHRELRRENGMTTNSAVPPMDQDWSDTDKLRWLASLVEYTTGVRCRINDSCSISGPGYVLGWPSYLELSVGEPGHQSSLSGDYHRIWWQLSAIEIGALAARRSLGLVEFNEPVWVAEFLDEEQASE